MDTELHTNVRLEVEPTDPTHLVNIDWVRKHAGSSVAYSTIPPATATEGTLWATPLGELWIYDGTLAAWIQLAPSPVEPPSRVAYPTVPPMDSAGGAAWVASWIYDATTLSTWIQLIPASGIIARVEYSVTPPSNPVKGAIWTTPTSELWIYSGAVWIQLA